MKTELIGNEALKTALFRKIKDNIFCASYVIEGARGTGKLTAARLAAAAMCCKSRQSDGMPCGECASCKKILSGDHVDVTEINPEKGKVFISVAQIREMLEQSMLVPSEADYRIFIIRDGTLLNANAQNAMLKSLEEPGEHLKFFILTHDASKLLPTVLSRSVRLKTELLPADRIADALSKRLPNADRKLILRSSRLSGGSLGRAIELVEAGGAPAAEQTVTDYFSAVADGSHHEKLCTILAPAAAKRDSLREVLNLMSSALRDIVVCSEKIDAEPLFFTDRDLLARAARRLGSVRASALFDRLAELIPLLDINVTPFAIASEVNIEFS